MLYRNEIEKTERLALIPYRQNMRKETGGGGCKWNEANGMAHALLKNVHLVKPRKSKGTRSCSSNWLKVKKHEEKRMA